MMTITKPRLRGAGPLQIGQRYLSLESDGREVGDETKTWDGYRVRVVAKRLHNVYGSWRYEYDFECVGVPEGRKA